MLKFKKLIKYEVNILKSKVYNFKLNILKSNI